MNKPPLSPAAQAIRAAVLSTYADTVPKDDALWAIERPSVIAVLRAVAMEVVLNKYQYADRDAQLRRDILAIADELEGA